MSLGAPDRASAAVPITSEPISSGFAWMLEVVHELAHAHSGPGAACLYLPGDGGEPIEICAAMSREVSADLATGLLDQGVNVVELVEPTRLFFPSIPGHEHALVIPLTGADGPAGALAVAATAPPLAKAWLARVMELADSGLSLVHSAAADARALAETAAQADRLDAELAQTRMFIELQERLVAARTTAEVVRALADWLDAPVAIQMPNLIVAEAAGETARDLALSAGRSEAEQELITRSTTEGVLPMLAPTGRVPARVVAPITGAGGEFAGFVIAAVGERGHDVTRSALRVSRGLIAYQMSVRQDIEASVATLRQTLLTDLLEKRFSEHVATQAAKLGHDLNSVHVPIAVGVLGTDITAVSDRLIRVIEHAAAQASAATVTSLIGIVEDMLVAFVPEPIPAGAQALAQLVYDEASSENLPVVVGVGPACTGAEAMPTTAAQARWTVEVLRTTAKSPRTSVGSRGRRGSPRLVDSARIAHFESLGVYGLLFDHTRSADLTAYAQRWLGPLLEYDRRHRSELVETLRQLFCQRSLSDAAAALHIHISTLKYRVGRIEEILGLSVESWDNVFHLELALRILSVADHLHAPGATDA